MKILTWNANMAFRKKQQHIIDAFDPDVYVIQECESPDKFDNNKPTFWIGDNKNKGLGVFSKVKPTPIDYQNNKLKYHIPFKIDDIYFIGIWSMNDKKNHENRYIGQVWNIINTYNWMLDEKIIILGDFNWNIILDKNPDYPLAGNFKQVIDRLSDYNISSIYHKINNEAFGEEKQPTLFMYRKFERFYHIDYVFAKDELEVVEFKVGKYDDWIEHSDHMPLLLEVN